MFTYFSLIFLSRAVLPLPPSSSLMASSPAPYHPAEKRDGGGGQRCHDLLRGWRGASARHFLEESQRRPDLCGRRQGRNCQKVHLALCLLHYHAVLAADGNNSKESIHTGKKIHQLWWTNSAQKSLTRYLQPNVFSSLLVILQPLYIIICISRIFLVSLNPLCPIKSISIHVWSFLNVRWACLS